MNDRPLSPITERSSFSSHRTDVRHSLDLPRDGPTPIREISYDSEREDGDDAGSIYSQVSSGETIHAAQTTTGALAYVGDASYPASTERMTMARPIAFPFPTTSPSPVRTSTPTSPNCVDIPPPGGLLPPPRGKRDSGQSFTSGLATPPLPTFVPVETSNRRRQANYTDSYPGGREIINLDDETDDEGDFDVRSVATATTAGLAGLGAGERTGVEVYERVEVYQKVEVETVQGALKGIMAEQDMQMRRFRESAPTPPRSRPNSFFYDQDHPTLHNIPTFSPAAEDQKPPVPPPFRTRISSMLVKSPPVSRPVSRPGSIKGGRSPDKTPRDDLASSEVTAPAAEALELRLQDIHVVRRELSIQDALDLSPPPILSAFSQPVTTSHTPSHSPRASVFPTSRGKTPPSTNRKRSSRIIPHVLFSLFSDTSSPERKRESGILEDERTDLKLNGASPPRPRTKSKLAKPRSAHRAGSQSSKSEIPISDGLPVEEGLRPKAEALEATVRLSGTFGVQDDGSDVFLPDASPPLGLGLRRWSSSNGTIDPKLFPVGYTLERSPDRRQRSSSFRTDITTGTAQPYAADRDRELFTQDAVVSTDDLVPIGHGRANENDLPPISERSDTGHTSSGDHTAVGAVQAEHRQMDTSPTRSDSPHTPEAELRTPDLGKAIGEGVSAVTPPQPLSVSHPTVDFSARIEDEIDAADDVAYAYPGVVYLQEEVEKGGVAAQKPQDGIPPAIQTPRRRLPSTPVPSQSRSTTPRLSVPGADRSLPRSRATSLSPSPSHSPVHPSAGLPPLPSSLQGLALSHTSPADLPLLIASHLLSSHAHSLMRHSSQAKDMGEEMFRLAQESLDWGKVLMSMASPPGAQMRDEIVQEGDGRVRPRTSSRARYDGLPASAGREEEDTYTRLPPRRTPAIPDHTPLVAQYLRTPTETDHRHLSPSLPRPSHIYPTQLIQPFPRSSPSEDRVDQTIARARRAERQRKSESLPPEWFQRVEHLSSSGWDKIHEAEQVWREGLEVEAKSLLRAGSVGKARAKDEVIPEEKAEVEVVDPRASNAYLALNPRDRPEGPVVSEQDKQEKQDGGLASPRPGSPVKLDRGQGAGGSRKLVKRPSRSVLPGSQMGREASGGGDTVKSKITARVEAGSDRAANNAGKAESTKSRWWKRKS